MLDVDNPSPALQRVSMDRMSHIFGWFQRMQTGSKPVPVSLIPFSARSSAKSETESHGSRNRKPKARTPEPDDDEEEPDHTKKPTPEDPKGKTPLSPPSAAATEVKPLETYINALNHHVQSGQPSNGDLLDVFPGTLSEPQRSNLATIFWDTVRSLLDLSPRTKTPVIPWSTYHHHMLKSAVVPLSAVSVYIPWVETREPTKTAVRNQLLQKTNHWWI